MASRWARLLAAAAVALGLAGCGGSGSKDKEALEERVDRLEARLRELKAQVERDNEGDLERDPETIRVGIVLAAKALARGEELRDASLREAKVAAVAITDDHILYAQRRAYIGRPVNRRVPAGRPVMMSYFLVGATPEEAIARRIAPGWRAITVEVDPVAGVAGLIRPGSRVDVLATFTEPAAGPGAKPQAITKVIARGVEVLAVETPVAAVPLEPAGTHAKGGSRRQTVTLHVLALEASLIAFASASGKLCLLLRSPHEEPPADGGSAVPDVNTRELEEMLAAARHQRHVAARKARPLRK